VTRPAAAASIGRLRKKVATQVRPIKSVSEPAFQGIALVTCHRCSAAEKVQFNFLRDVLGADLARKPQESPMISMIFGGGGGIRTHGRVTPASVFKTGALDHSATPPTRGAYAGTDDSESAGLPQPARGRFPLIVKPRTRLCPFQPRANNIWCAEGRRTWSGQGRQQPRGFGLTGQAATAKRGDQTARY
jgi:hypothetical protein